MGEGDGASGGKAPGHKPKKAPAKPDLPPKAPAGIVDFVGCTADTVAIKKGTIDWLPDLPDVDVAFEPGEAAGSVKATISKSVISASVTASVKDGKLDVDTSGFPDFKPFSTAKKNTKQWVDRLNKWLEHNGKKLSPPVVKDGGLALEKAAIAPAGQAEPKGPGIKAAAGAGALMLGVGLGLGGIAAPDGDVWVPTAPNGAVQVVEADHGTPSAPAQRSVTHLPSGPVAGRFTATPAGGGAVVPLTVTLLQDGSSLRLTVPGLPPFLGTIDDEANFDVANEIGAFDGMIAADHVTGDHVYRGRNYTIDGTLDQPVVDEKKVTDPVPPAHQPLVQGIGEGLGFVPVSDTAGGGANIPAGLGGIALIGLGGALLVVGSKDGKPGIKEPPAGDATGGILEGFAGMGLPPTPPTTYGDVAERDWHTLVQLEEQRQQQLLDAFQHLLADVAGAGAQFNVAFDTYRTTYSRVLSGSTELQGLLQAWAESQDTLEKADLAFAILTLLVSGVTLGIKGVRLIKGVGAGGKVAAEGAKVAETAAVAIDAATDASGLAKANLKVANQLAAEAGVSLSETMAKHGGSLEGAVKEIAEIVFAKRGWHYLAEYPSVMAGQTVDVSGVVSRLVANTRSALAAAAKRGGLTAAPYKGLAAGGSSGPSLAIIKKDIEILKEIASKDPNFLKSLPTAVVDIWEPTLQIAKTGAASGTEALRFELELAKAQANLARVAELEKMLAAAQKAAEIQGNMTVKLLGTGDFDLLVKVLEADGDIVKLQQLLGPAAAITLTEIVGKVGLSVGSTYQTTMNMFVTGSSSQIYDIADFSKSFGVVGRYEDSMNAGTFMAGELWHLVTSPFKTVGEHYYTHEALDAQERFMEAHGTDLQAMADAAQKAVDALEAMQRAIDHGHLDDPKAMLGGKGATQLRSVIDEMRQALDGASDGFKGRHGKELEDREAHVAQKLGTVDRVLGELKALDAKLPQLVKWLDELQHNPDGTLRPVTTGIDPHTLMRMGSAFLYLNGVLAGIATGKGGGGK